MFRRNETGKNDTDKIDNEPQNPPQEPKVVAVDTREDDTALPRPKEFMPGMDKVYSKIGELLEIDKIEDKLTEENRLVKFRQIVEALQIYQLEKNTSNNEDTFIKMGEALRAIKTDLNEWKNFPKDDIEKGKHIAKIREWKNLLIQGLEKEHSRINSTETYSRNAYSYGFNKLAGIEELI